MLNPHGQLSIGEEWHCDTFKCNHCQVLVCVLPHEKPADKGGHCKKCDSLVCRKCYAIGECEPFEVKLEKAESRSRFLRQAGL